MKGTLIVILFVGCTILAKAQQAPNSNKQQPLQNFKLLPDSIKRNDFSYKWMDSLGKAKNNLNEVIKQNIIANANIDNTPIVKPQINSKMPIVQTDRTGYTMPVVGMSVPRVYIMNKLNEQKPVAPANNNDVK